jgi:hypothetical protein
VIRDTLIGEGKHKMDIFFQLGQYRAIRIDKRTLAAMINFGEKVLKVIPVINKPERLSVEEGWYSSGYGTKTRSKVLKYSKTSVLPVEFLFVLSLRKSVLEDKEIREIFSKFNNRL